MGHRAAVNVVDFDDRYIVSASGDRTIKVCIYIYVVPILYMCVLCGIPVSLWRTGVTLDKALFDGWMWSGRLLLTKISFST